MKNKSGISLVILVITIVIMSILATVVLINTNNSTDDALRAAFTDELTTILQATNEYYLNNGVYPISNVYTREQVINLATSEENKLKLENEMILNKDNDTLYYEINLELIRVSGGLIEENAVYIINSDATDIYYPIGFEIDEDVYFSLSSNLTVINKLDTSSTSMNTNSGIDNITNSIILSKSVEGWTNNLTITVTTTINSEELYYTVGGVEQQLTSSEPYTVNLSKNTLTSEQQTNLKTDPNIYFTKKNNGVIVAKSSIDISNLDVVAPILNSEPTIVPANGYNVVKFITQMQDTSGILESYYTTNLNIAADEIVTSGIKGEASYINLDKSISNINMVMVDRAGNVSEIISVTIPSEYIK